MQSQGRQVVQDWNHWLGSLDEVWDVEKAHRATGNHVDSLVQTRGGRDENLRLFIDQRCQRLEASFAAQIQTALPAAAMYFLQCQEAKQQGKEMPAPPRIQGIGAGTSGTLVTAAQAPLAEPHQSSPLLVESPPIKTAMVSDDSGGPDRIIHRDNQNRSKMLYPSPENMKTRASVMEHANWEMSQVDSVDQAHTWYAMAFDRLINESSRPMWFMESIGLGRITPKVQPAGRLVELVSSTAFETTSIVMIIGNTILSAVCADMRVRALLEDPAAEEAKWVEVVDTCFTIFFICELLIRLFVYRMWFFVQPGNWGWNIFDCVLVGFSSFTLVFSGLDVDAFRTLRMFRVVRIARLVRIVRVFNNLRKLLFAVSAALASLFWAALFLFLVFFMFALLILKGIDAGSADLVDTRRRHDIYEHFNGLGDTIMTLFTVVFGADWLVPHHPLQEFGGIFNFIIPLFVIFVNLGIMNIVIGVFSQCAERISDQDMVAMDEIGDVEDFIQSMINIYRDFAPADGELKGYASWEDFKQYFHDEKVQAYLHSQHMDATHARLVHKLCDKNHDGKVDIREFVLGMVRLKGSSREVETKIMLHTLGALGQDVELLRHDMKKFVGS